MIEGSRLRAPLYGLFALSGAAGLIYESIWSHYLKLFLGHAAYAQTLVLVIFMGGMAVGSWIAGQRSPSLSRPLRAYALVEAGLCAGALLFDPLFRGMQSWMFDSVIPQLGSPLLIDAVKWSASALIVLPQSILLGATFPLMSAAVTRLDSQSAGRSLSWLYFTNSLGAAVGVLVSGFYLIAAVGLPGTIVCAGLINGVLALVVRLMAGRIDSPHSAPVPRRPGSEPTSDLHRVLITVAFLTGTASFFYEIGWIRMLSLVLGSATHSFELMLSAFIFGIAVGSFYIRNRIQAAQHRLGLLGWIQVAMGTTAFLSIPIYNQSFDWMAFIIHGLKDTDAGYTLFNILSHGICLTLMLPVTFFAGMTLPLITAILLDSGYGESSIGRVYSANTLGSIAGVLLAVHLVMPYWGLRQVIVCGAFTDLLLGIWLLLRAGHTQVVWTRAGVSLSLTAAAIVTIFVHFKPAQLASGVYRFGNPIKQGAIIFHRDGKTASVDVSRQANGSISIATNGKTDANIIAGNVPSPDDYTMILSAILPMMEKPHAARSAVIGFGSGRTTHTLLADPQLASVDTIEIEPAMVEGARQFGELTHRAYDDPRSHIHIEDAKTYFARSGQRYDVIVAEPSNPWVSGVASLFSKEFYSQIKRHLASDGIFVQWLQLYEINIPLIASVATALDAQFDDYAIYSATNNDILIVTTPKGHLPALSDWIFKDSAISGMLRPLDIRTMADVENRRLGGKRTLSPFFADYHLPTNSDYFPVLDQFAVKARFLHIDASNINQLHQVSQRLEGDEISATTLTPTTSYDSSFDASQAQLIASYFTGSQDHGGNSEGRMSGELMKLLTDIQSLNSRCEGPILTSVWQPAFRKLAALYLPYLTPADTRDIVAVLQLERCFSQAPQEIRDWIGFFGAIGEQDWPSAQLLGDKIMATKPSDQADVNFLAREMILAEIRGGRADVAREQIRQLPARVTESIPIRYLRAYLNAVK